jgi:hypothetical protein
MSKIVICTHGNGCPYKNGYGANAFTHCRHAEAHVDDGNCTSEFCNVATIYHHDHGYGLDALCVEIEREI